MSQAPPELTEVAVIPEGGAFEGLLTFSGRARIDGCLTGRVVAEGCLVIGPGARVEARIEVDQLVVGGSLEGEVLARDRVQLLESARFEGSMTAPRLEVAAGSVFQGRCRTRSPGSRGTRPGGPAAEPS